MQTKRNRISQKEIEERNRKLKEEFVKDVATIKTWKGFEVIQVIDRPSPQYSEIEISHYPDFRGKLSESDLSLLMRYADPSQWAGFGIKSKAEAEGRAACIFERNAIWQVGGNVKITLPEVS